MKKNVFWKILIYFIIYSVFGFFLETIYAILTKGMLESRQSFLYGPFCIVYGIGAIVLIGCLEKYKSSNVKLFLWGSLYGAIVEYFTSYIAEITMHVKWWDYSNAFLNINGRTCLYYAVCWGILSICLIKYINPYLEGKIDKFFEYRQGHPIKYITAFTMIFMTVNGFVSFYAINCFLERVSNDYNINIVGVKSKATTDFENKIFSNEKMMMTYPNMLVVNDKHEIIGLDSVLSNVKKYYYNFSDK